jgi:hypothetical protein
VLPRRIDHWSLTSPQQRLVKTGGRLVKHARDDWLLLAEGHLTRRLFGARARRIAALAVPAGSSKGWQRRNGSQNEERRARCRRKRRAAKR